MEKFKQNHDPLAFLEAMVQVIEREQKDIAPEEKQFSEMTFAIANSCGEAGRELYKRICGQWSKGVNAPELLDKKYDYALKTGRGGNSLGTVYHLFKSAGLSLPEACVPTQATGATLNNSKNMTEENEIINDIEVEEVTKVELPHFDQQHEWPWPLNEIVEDSESEEQRDILFLGAVTALGATMGKKVGTMYDQKIYHPSIFLIITAPSSKGKSGVSGLKQILMPIHNEMKENSDSAPRMFIIPANNTSAGINKNIVDNKGQGIMIESEADTLSASLKGQFGNFSDVLRKAFDHDQLTFNRKLNSEFSESEPMALSLMISGTPGQVRTLVSTTENGLFARIVYYYLQGRKEWVNKFNYEVTETSNAKYLRIGEEWKKVYDELQTMESVMFYLTEEQVEHFLHTMALLKEKAVKLYGDSMEAYVNRLAISLLRIMTVVAFLRSKDVILEHPAIGEREKNVKIDLNDSDFFAILSMAEIIYTHATRVLSFLPETTVSYTGSPEREKLLNSMSKVFTRKAWHDMAAQMEVKKGTAKKWLERLQKSGAIKRIAEATYQKC